MCSKHHLDFCALILEQRAIKALKHVFPSTANGLKPQRPKTYHWWVEKRSFLCEVSKVGPSGAICAPWLSVHCSSSPTFLWPTLLLQ